LFYNFIYNKLIGQADGRKKHFMYKILSIIFAAIRMFLHHPVIAFQL